MSMGSPEHTEHGRVIQVILVRALLEVIVTRGDMVAHTRIVKSPLVAIDALEGDLRILTVLDLLVVVIVVRADGVPQRVNQTRIVPMVLDLLVAVTVVRADGEPQRVNQTCIVLKAPEPIISSRFRTPVRFSFRSATVESDFDI